VSAQHLSLAPVAELELVDGELVAAPADITSAAPLSPSPPPSPPRLEVRNLFGEAERIAGRAASASTRRQYGAIFRAFGDWLAGELGRPPVVGDLDADVIAAYGRHLAASGGRGGGTAAPATVRVYLSMIRALARGLGLDEAVESVRVPRHEPGPPETLTDSDYANLLRVPDRRTTAGKRDYALLRVLGDCGLRSAELRGLRARDLRRPRTNARHHRLYVHGKGGREREVPVPEAVQQALDAWLKVHPLARGVGRLDDQPLFVRLGRHGDQDPLPLPRWPSTGSCAGTAWPPACRSGSRTHMRSGSTGQPTCSRPASPSTRCPPASGTSTSGRLPATPRRGLSASMRSPRCSIVGTRLGGAPVGGRKTPS
jgi:integrase